MIRFSSPKSRTSRCFINVQSCTDILSGVDVEIFTSASQKRKVQFSYGSLMWFFRLIILEHVLRASRLRARPVLK